jgi:hypothetical protein
MGTRVAGLMPLGIRRRPPARMLLLLLLLLLLRMRLLRTWAA